MAGELRRSYRQGFREDILALPSRQLQKAALQIVMDVAKGRRRGRPLESHVATGDLSDCRKVYFDEVGSNRPRFRLVYRLLPDEVQAVEVAAVAVGMREALAAYVAAASRLGRMSDPG